MSKRFLTAAAGSLALFIGAANTQAAVLEPLTSFGGGDGYLAPGDATYLTTDSTQRGIAYNPGNNHVYIVNRAGSLSVPILNGDTGAQIGSLDTTGISGGTFALNMIRVADDGAIYGANLTTGANTTTGALKIYRWANESAAPTVVYSGDAGLPTARFGDNMDLRGSGANTQIIFGRGTTGVDAAFFTTTDGNTFTPQVFTPTGANNGDFRLGIAFGDGNTYFGRQTGTGNSHLRRVTFDPATGTTTLDSNSTFATVTGPIDFDPATDLLGAVGTGGAGAAQTARLYDLADFANATLQDTETFPTTNANSNNVGSVAIAGDRMYVLITNNGLAAYTIVVPEPGVLGLLSLGGISLLARRRR